MIDWIGPGDVTACLITRGDTDLTPIIDRLIGYSEVLIWDTGREDHGVYGRYELVAEARNNIVYLQDDDCSIPRATQLALVDAYEPGVLVANYGHGDNPDGYEDVALVHGGAIVDKDLPARALARYLDYYPYDVELEREADMVVGCLTPHKYLHLPYDILPLASHPSRMANQPWQRDLKLKITNRAREVRDRELVA